jgi:ABC-type Fe3+/spermidine/putrescine transport system ATPase subunit
VGVGGDSRSGAAPDAASARAPGSDAEPERPEAGDGGEAAPAPAPVVCLELEGISKSFGDQRVLDQVTLRVGRGEIFALLGPSGSGKTTLLRVLAGFERPDTGRLLLDGEDLTRTPPARRGFGLVFQSYALFPHLSVGDNVAFGLDSMGWERKRVRDRVREMLSLVDLDGFERRRVTQISGGQQQRVALARALAPYPRLLLLDEPLSNLDPTLRERTRAQLRATLRRVGITTLLVTHEQEEAFELGDRVAVLHHGVLEQEAPPRELYRTPRTRFVAGFVGRSNWLPALVEEVRGPDATVRLLLAEAGTSGGVGREPVLWTATGSELSPGQRVEVMVRPEALELVEAGGPAGAIVGRVTAVRFGGAVSHVTIESDGGERLEAQVRVPPALGRRVAVSLGAEGPPPRAFLAPGQGMPRR